MTLLDIKQVSYSYGKRHVLSDISFNIRGNEICGIIGPNGSGKSTLIKLISGLFPANSGQILLNGKSISKFAKKELAKQIAVLEQEGTPPLSFTVYEIVSMGRYPWLRPLSDLVPKDIEVIERVLRELDLWSRRYKPVDSLSGGERQLVSLARALVQEPSLLILDEPTTYLDIGHQTLVMEHVKNWQKENKTSVLLVIHDLNLAAQYCDNLILLNDGELIVWGKSINVLNEQIISKVYRTKLVMINHPMSGVPQFLLTSK